MMIRYTREAGWYGRYRATLYACSVLLLSVTSQPVLSAPTGADLRNACTEALTSGFDGVNGQMCTWYVLPCNCGVNEGLPAVCLPGDVPVTELATGFISDMAKNPDLESQPAAEAAATILSRHYPCTGQVKIPDAQQP